jgi:hypothetical protein
MRPLIAVLLILVVVAVFGIRLLAADSASKLDLPGSYATLLAAYVDEQGRVDYAGIKARRNLLDEYTAALAALDAKALAAADEADQIALWINAYNAYTLQVIVDHYPIDVQETSDFPSNSIQQIPSVWDAFTFDVAGDLRSLNQIEHDVLRKRFNEPRIHMALVCAAIACPPLRGEPYTGERLDEQFDDQSRQFLALERNLRIDGLKGNVYLSSIFDWFAEDFAGLVDIEDIPGDHDAREQGILKFVSRYVSDEDRKYVLSGTYAVSFVDYDWRLNEQ